MVGVSQILLRNLHFNHCLSLLKMPEKRAERLARLKIDRTVLYLNQHIISKLAVERHKLFNRLFGAVGTFGVVHKGAPHNNSAKRLKRFGNHIGAVSVRAAVVLRSRLPFRVGFHQKTAKIGNQFVDFGHLRVPPRNHFIIKRVRCLKVGQMLWRRKVQRQIDLQSVWAENFG